MPSPKIGVIFDMDGVIVDSEPFHVKIEEKLFSELGIDLPEEERFRFLGVSSRDMWSQLKADYDLDHSLEELIRMGRDRYASMFSGFSAPFVPGALELIRELHDRNVPLAIASSSSSRHISDIVKRGHLDTIVSVRVGGDQVGRSKPDPEIFRKAVEGLRPFLDEQYSSSRNDGAFIVVEDSPNGVIAALRAGLYVIGFMNPNSGSPDLSHAHRVCTTMEEVATEIGNVLVTGIPTSF